MLKYVRVVPLLLLFYVIASPEASAVGTGTVLSYADGELGGYTITWLDYGEGEEYFCEDYNALLDHCYWWGRVVPWVSEWGRLYDPASNLHYQDSNWTYWDMNNGEAYVDYYVSSPQPGTWVAEGEHYLGWDYYREYCSYVYQYCYGEDFIGPDWAPLDDSSDMAYVPSLDVTQVSWSPVFFFVPDCTALSVDPSIDAFEFYYTHNGGSPAYVDYWGNGDPSCVGEQQSGQFGTYVVTAVRNLAGGEWFYPQQANPPQPATVTIQANPYLHSQFALAGVCGGQARGESITALLVNPTGLSNFVWSFTAGSVGSISNQNSGNTDWSGVVAVTGVIRVDYTIDALNGAPDSRQCNLTVTARPWSSPTAVSLYHPNGAPNGTYGTFPTGTGLTTPPNKEAPLGLFTAAADHGPPNNSINNPINDNGPNQGFLFVRTPPALFSDYQINPDLANSQSAFSIKQCGNYTTNNGAYISWQNLFDQTVRHEVGNTGSHYAKFKGVLTSNNIGSFYENKVWGPGNSISSAQFITDVTNGGTTMSNQIAATWDPGDHTNVPDVNYTANGVTALGNINWYPFNQLQAPTCP
jgi:hypothetical protein